MNEMPRSRRRSPQAEERGPSPDEVADALETVLTTNVPGTPRVGALRTLTDALETPFSVGTRTVREVSIRRGDPNHGAKRSDDHIGAYEVAAPLSEVSPAAFDGDECPNCMSTTAVYSFGAYHHMAASESLVCETCEQTLHAEEWG